jgi:hypothetical protein
MKFSLGVKKTNDVKLTTDRKRPRALLDDDEEPEIEQPIAITGFADGGVIHKEAVKEEKAPVIRGIPNRDWREESKRKRQRSRMPGAEQHAQVSEAEIKEKEAKVMQFGLTVVQKEARTDDEGDLVMEEKVEEAEVVPVPKPPPNEINDEAALQAILHGNPVDDEKVIIAATEEEAFERDIQTAPDAPTLDDYEAMPVESFALAYLRGYGYKEGQDLGKEKSGKAAKAVRPARRPALLGIGAKEDAAVGVELGTWGKASKGKRKVDEMYNPLVMVNKQTGEKLSEEELQKKLEQQKLLKQEEESGRRKKRSPSPRDSDYRSEKSSRKITYDDDYERDRRRKKERDRERYKDDDGDRDRRRERDSDRDRARDKDRDRDRGKDSDRDRDRDRRRDYDSKYSSSRKDRDRREQSPSSDDRKRKRRDYDDDRDSEGSKRRHKDDRERERGSSKRDGRDRERDRDRYSSSRR